MARDKVDDLYDNLKEDGWVENSREHFRAFFLAPGKQGYENRKALYDNMKADGYVESPTYEEFAKRMGLHAVGEKPGANKPAQAPATAAKPVGGGVVSGVPQGATSMQGLDYFRLRRGGSDFVVPVKDVDAAGGLVAWEKKNPGAPVRVYMSGVDKAGNPFSSHVPVSEAHKRVKDYGYKYNLTNDTSYPEQVAEYEQRTVIERLEKEQDDLMKKAEERRRAIEKGQSKSWMSMMVDGLMASESGQLSASEQKVAYDPEYRQLIAAAREKRKEIDQRKRLRDKANGEDIGFWRGFGDTVKEPDLWLGGIPEAYDALGAVSALENPNTESAQALLEAKMDRDAADRDGDFGLWYGGGIVAGNMLPFMVDMGVSGSITGSEKFVVKGVGKALSTVAGKRASALAQKASSKAIARASETSVGRLLAKGAETKVGQVVTKAIGAAPDDLIRAAFTSNVIQHGKTFADIVDRKMGQVVDAGDSLRFQDAMDWGRAVAQGEMNGIIENYSESFGNVLDEPLSAASKHVSKKLASVFGMKAVSRGLCNMVPKGMRTTASALKAQLQEHFKLSGFVGELSEEYWGQLLRTVCGSDDAYDEQGRNNFLKWEFHRDLWSGMALSMGFMNGVTYGASAAHYGAMKVQLEGASRNASRVMGKDEWDEIRAQIDACDNDNVMEVVAGIADESGSREAAGAVFEYGLKLAAYRGYNIGVIASEDGGELGSGTDQNGVDAELEAARADFDAAFGIDADYWMGRVEADVMDVLSEPTLNEDRRMAVLRYVGARRRAAARVSAAEAVRAKVHPNKKTIVPAVLKLGDQQVFVVGGDVVMSADGKVVDLQRSSRSVLVYNAETGETKFVEPSAILRVEAEVDPMVEAPPQPSPQGEGAVSSPTPDVPTSEGAVPSPTPALPAREGAMPAEGVPDSAVSSAENGANSAVADEPTAETALSRVPVDEKGKAQFDKVEPAVAWDAVMEKTGGDAEMAKDFVDNMVAESEKALAKLEKGKPKSSTDIDEFIANKKAHQDAIAEAKRVLEHWKAVAEEDGARQAQMKADAELAAEERERREARDAERQANMEANAKRLSQYREAIKGMGDVNSLREYIIRLLLSGKVKLRWDNTPYGSKGVNGYVFGFKDNIRRVGGDYGARRWMLDDNGISVETFIEDICQQYFSDYERDTDHTSEVGAELTDILLKGSPDALWEALMEERAAYEEANRDGSYYPEPTPEEIERDQAFLRRYGMGEEDWLEFESAHGEEIDMSDEEYAELMDELSGERADDDAVRARDEELLNELLEENARQNYEAAAGGDGFELAVEESGQAERTAEDGSTVGDALRADVGTDLEGSRPSSATDVRGSAGRGVESRSEVEGGAEIDSELAERQLRIENGELLPESMDEIPQEWRDSRIQSEQAVEVESPLEIPDDVFRNYSQSYLLPKLPENLARILNAIGRKVLLKRGVFAKNNITHGERSNGNMTAQESKELLNRALYSASLAIKNQPETRPYNWVVVRLANKNDAVVLEVNNTKEYLEIVGWEYRSDKKLRNLYNQANRNGGLIIEIEESQREDDPSLIQDSEEPSAAGLSALPRDSEGKDSALSADMQASKEEISEEGGELRSGTEQNVDARLERLAELDARVREINDLKNEDVVLPEGVEDSPSARRDHKMKMLREAVDELAAAAEGLSDQEVKDLSKEFENLRRVTALRMERQRQEQERQRERDKLQTTYDNADALPVSGKKPKKFSMHEVAGTDNVTQAMITGVHHSPTGEAVATDTHVIVVSKKDFKPEHEGKVVDKNGAPVQQKVIDGKKVTMEEAKGQFPAYERLLPKDKPVATAPLSDEAVQAACGVSVRGEQKAYIAVDFGDGNIMTLDLYCWNRFLRGAKHIGATELEFRGAHKPVVARSEDGWAMCMPSIYVSEVDKVYRQDLNSEHQSGAIADMEAKAAQSRRAAEARKQGGEKFRTEFEGEERTGSDGVMPAEEVRAGTKKWTEATGIEVQVFDRAEEIEDEYLRAQVKAQLDMGRREVAVAYKGKVYVYGRGVKNAEWLEKSMIHEIVTHLGLEGVLGTKGKKELLGRIWKELMSPAEQDKWMKYPGVRDEYDAAEEWLAHKSEAMDVKGSRSLWAKIGSWFRDLLGRFGLNLKLTDDVLLDTLRRSYQDLVTKKTEADVRFRLGGEESFEERQKRAVANKGTVTPGLRDMEFKVVDVPRHDFTGTGKQAIDKAFQWALNNLVGEHTAHKDEPNEFKYLIDDDVIGKYLSESSTKSSDNLGIHLAVLKELKAIIDASIEVEEHADYRKINGSRSIANGLQSEDVLMHRFYGAVTIDGVLYRVKTSFKEMLDEAKTHPYNYQVTELELLISGSKTSDALSNPSSITGAKLLNGVEKSYDAGKKILDESENNVRFRVGDDVLLGEDEYPATSERGTKLRGVEDGVAVYVDKDGRPTVLLCAAGDGSFIGLKRKPGTNRWSCKAENDMGPDVWRKVITTALAKLPEGAEVYENKSLSVDGMRMFGKMLENGFERTGETFACEVNVSDKANVFEANEAARRNFGSVRRRVDEIEDVRDRMQAGLDALGLDREAVRIEPNPRSDFGRVKVEAPVLRKASRSGVEVSMAVELSEQGRRMQARAEELGAKLGTKIRIEVDTEALRGKRSQAKGWYDTSTGEVVVVVPNHSSVADVENTVVHEIVGHKGLRAMVGEERFGAFLDDVYKRASQSIRDAIDARAAKGGMSSREATEEYMSDMAGEIGDKGFEEMDHASRTFWGKVTEGVRQMIDFVMRSIGLNKKSEVNDKEVAYMLYKSWKGMRAKSGAVAAAEDALMRAKTGFNQVGELRSDTDQNDADGLRFRLGDDVEGVGSVAAREIYEQRVRTSGYQVREALQDSMLGLREAYDAIEKASGRKRGIEDIPTAENAYTGENRLSSRTREEQKAYEELCVKPLLDEVAKLAPKSRAELTEYMMAKHGLERNAKMRARAVADGMDASEAGATDFAGLTGLAEAAGEVLTGNRVAMAEAWAAKRVADYESDNATDALWAAVNAATKATLSKLYEGGLLSKAAHDDIAKMYDFYIPLRGWAETTTDEVYGYLTRTDAGVRKSVLKEAKGRGSVADDPIATIAMMGEHGIAEANRNMMKQSFLNYVRRNPSDLVSVNRLWLKKNDVTGEWEAAFPDNIYESDDAATVAQKWEAFEAKMESLAQAEPDRFKRGRQAQGIPYKIGEGVMNEHVVTVKCGDDVYVLTINGNPRAAQALNGLTNPDNGTGYASKLIKYGERINHWIAPAYTTRNPDFMLSNFLRDAFYTNTMTWVKESPGYAARFNMNFLRVNPIHMIKLISMYEKGELDMSNPLHRHYRDFMQNGGETGYTSQRDLEKHKKDIERMLKQANGRVNVRKIFEYMGAKWDVLNNAAENCARFAAYLTSREEGRDVGRSIWDSKEVSVNFNKKGAGAKFLDATGQTAAGNAAALVSGSGRGLYVFWNAVVQASTNYMRNAKRHPVKFTAGVTAMFGLGLLQAIFGAWDDDDDDDKKDDRNDYYNQPDYVRRSHLLLGLGDKFLAHPLPHEYLPAFGMGELAGSLMTGKQEMSGGEIALEMSGLLSEFSPIKLSGASTKHSFIPSSVKPVVEATMNESWTGLPIYKETPYNEKMPEWTKAYPSANRQLVNLCEAVSRATGGNDYKRGSVEINPAVIEYVLNGYLGGYYQTLDKTIKTAETIAGTREFEWRNMPFASRVIKQGDERTAGRRVSEDYWKLQKDYEETDRLIRSYKKDPDRARYTAALAELSQTPEFRNYWVFKGYKKSLDGLDDLMKGATGEELKALEGEQMDLRRELVGKIRGKVALEPGDMLGFEDAQASLVPDEGVKKASDVKRGLLGAEGRKRLREYERVKTAIDGIKDRYAGDSIGMAGAVADLWRTADQKAYDRGAAYEKEMRKLTKAYNAAGSDAEREKVVKEMEKVTKGL